MDKITFNMATMPPRVKPLEDCVKSILPQCDHLNVYLNGFGDKETPRFLINPKITVFRSENEAGDIGDVGKFYTCEDWEGYIFTVDDKYIYPVDYAKRMIDTIEQYGRKAVVACHGRNVKPNCTSYYNDPDKMFCLGGEVLENEFSHELGTGCMALHTDTFKFSLDIFTHTNVTDILVSMAIQRANVPILMMAHKYQWVRTSPRCDQVYSIHNFLNGPGRDVFQTKLVNNFNWKINRCEALY